MVISHTRGTRDMVILSSNKGFPIKVPLMLHLSSTKLWCPTLIHGGNCGVSSLFISTCSRCGMRDEGKCLASTGGFLGCRNSGLKKRDYPMLMAKGREGKHDQPSGFDSSASKKNWFYALHSSGEQKGSLDVFYRYVKSLPTWCLCCTWPDATLSLVTPYVAMKFDILSYVLDSFSFSTVIGDSIVAKRIYRKCLISLSLRVTRVDLVELHILEFDVILGIDWLHLWYVLLIV